MGEPMVISCSAGYGSGGLGRHLQELVDAGIADGSHVTCLSTRPPAEGPQIRSIAISIERIKPLLHLSPLRFSPGWMQCVGNSLFDRAVAARLQKPQAPLTVFTGFGGQSLRSIRRARELGFDRIDLVAANSHVRNVQRLHAQAYRRWPLERSWLNEHQIVRTIAEYNLSDRIIVASQYTQQTLEQYGIPSRKIQRFRYKPHARFSPPAVRQPHAGRLFRIVATGSLTVVKGIPLLIEAIAALKELPIELRLVGGTASRGMRRYLETLTLRNPSINFAPGDPLPLLQQADLFVHPSFEDGFAYAPVEAMACGVPVIVTSDTGMKECIRDLEQGEIVLTGDRDGLAEAIRRRFNQWRAAKL